jgi:16S rRNA (cytidine1402-2'-O)-methyltransferase
MDGLAVALISDAGTPLISDPGFELVRRCREAAIPVIPVPGPCAVVAALSAAGLPSDRFVFEGFPPARSAGRQALFANLVQEQRTLVFYESPHRIAESLADMVAVFGPDREAVVCRELTKTWETIRGDSLSALLDWLRDNDNNRRGEFVVLVRGRVAPVEQELSDEAERVLKILMAELPLKQAAALAAEVTAAKKNLLYKRGLVLQLDSPGAGLMLLRACEPSGRWHPLQNDPVGWLQPRGHTPVALLH